MRELYGVREGLAEGYKVLSHVPDPGLEDLGPPLVVLGILCCHTCWLGDFGALGLPGASDEGIVVGRWHSRLLSRTAWHPGPCWSRGSGWGGRDGEARQGVRGLHALQTGRCSSGAGIEERQRGWAPLSWEGREGRFGWLEGARMFEAGVRGAHRGEGWREFREVLKGTAPDLS